MIDLVNFLLFLSIFLIFIKFIPKFSSSRQDYIAGFSLIFSNVILLILLNNIENLSDILDIVLLLFLLNILSLIFLTYFDSGAKSDSN